MAKTKEQLEEEINSTKYFSISGDNTEALRKTEEYKLVSNVFIYCRSFFLGEQTARELGYEIYSICKRCLKNYNINRSVPFLHYFIKSLGNEKERLRIKERRENQKFADLKDFTGTENSNNFTLDNTLEDSKNSSVEESVITENSIKEFLPLLTLFSKANKAE